MSWPAPGSEDTEFGVLMEPEVRHGEAELSAVPGWETNGMAAKTMIARCAMELKYIAFVSALQRDYLTRRRKAGSGRGLPPSTRTDTVRHESQCA